MPLANSGGLIVCTLLTVTYIYFGNKNGVFFLYSLYSSPNLVSNFFFYTQQSEFMSAQKIEILGFSMLGNQIV
jgi:hypothetical protein